MTVRAICIHGHYYQPPRENPWLEAIEQQDSAYPFHDWNERVHAECYRNNATSRVLDGEGRIRRIVNNYARTSFNIGPTLLSWMQEADPVTYRAILDADRQSREHFAGHGSALAQIYNHVIMPLASARDKTTQVRWGLRDFAQRFGRPAEGMWLSETAVDMATLETLAECGVRFTVLAPSQAARVRRRGESEWRAERVDSRRAYRAPLPSGRSIDLFFYDGEISQQVAFGGLLQSGDRFTSALLMGFGALDEPQLVHIATDGETYGHHHPHGDMALSYAIDRIGRERDVRLMNYAQFLAVAPPAWEVEIRENTSWSCAHGVERWRSDCGCKIDPRTESSQAWRRPLREALDGLRAAAIELFERRGAEVLRDPWAARDAYIDVQLDRSPQNVDRFLAEHATDRGRADEVTVLRLCELQRNAMLMYTSCGWFFDDLAGIETVQVLAYAGRVTHLASALGTEIEEPFLAQLSAARSNRVEQGTGRDIFERYVRPACVDRRKLIAHYAVSSLFDPYTPRAAVYAYDLEHLAHESLPVGTGRMLVGRAKVSSRVTRAAGEYDYALLHLGDHNLMARVEPNDAARSAARTPRLLDVARRGETAELVRELDRGFEGPIYSLRSLLKDQQRKVLAVVLRSTEQELEQLSGQLYERYAPLVRFLGSASFPLPRALVSAVEFVLNTTLRRVGGQEPLDVERVRALLAEAQGAGVALDTAGVGMALSRTLDRLAQRWGEEPQDLDRLEEFARATGLIRSLPFSVDLFGAQNVLVQHWQGLDPARVDREGPWWRSLQRTAEALRVALEG